MYYNRIVDFVAISTISKGSSLHDVRQDIAKMLKLNIILVRDGSGPRGLNESKSCK